MGNLNLCSQAMMAQNTPFKMRAVIFVSKVCVCVWISLYVGMHVYVWYVYLCMCIYVVCVYLYKEGTLYKCEKDQPRLLDHKSSFALSM